MKLQVEIKQDDSSSHQWTPLQLQRYLVGIMENRGATLCIHASDGTKIEVFPKAALETLPPDAGEQDDKETTT